MSPWRSELSFVFLALLFGAFFGKLFNQAALVLWLCLIAYLARHLFFANRLLTWLRGGRANQMPQGDGVWEEIYYLIFRLRRRNKRRKKQLIHMLERFRTATAALPDATVVLGPRDEIDWFNEAAGQLLGLRRGDIGQKIGNLLRYPKFTDYLQRHDYHQAKVGIPSPVAENVQVEIRVVPYGEDLRLLVAQDVTQLRFMERVRTDFVANVSHELRTPLTVLKGYLETLSDAESTPAAYLKVFRSMEEQTTRMQSLIDGLLSLTRLESGAHAVAAKRVDVPAMLKLIREEAELLSDRAPTIELRLETQACLLGSEPELRSAFSNLVVNAVKYTPPEGRVIVRWRNDGPGIRLDVEDTGPGIAQEHLPRLTERFYRVDVEGGKGGSGLGLAITKHVMARHGAELKIVSALGKGSCFSCCFPEQRVAGSRPASEIRASAA